MEGKPERGLHFLGPQLKPPRGLPHKGWNLLRPTIRLCGPEAIAVDQQDTVSCHSSRIQAYAQETLGSGHRGIVPLCLAVVAHRPALWAGEASQPGGRLQTSQHFSIATGSPTRCSSAPGSNAAPRVDLSAPSSLSLPPPVPPLNRCYHVAFMGLGLFTCIYINRQTSIPA